MLLAEVCDELHEGSSKRANGRGRRYQALDVAPANFNPHIIVAAAIASMREAVPSPLAGPPRSEPIGCAQLPQLGADVVDQECLCVLGKCWYSNIFHLQGLFVEQIVLVARIRTVKVMGMMIVGGCDACANEMSDMRRKETKGVHTGDVIATNIGRKAQHVAGEACPSGKLVSLGLVDRKLVGSKFFTFEIRRNVITGLECATQVENSQSLSVFALSTAITAFCISKKATL